MPHMQNSWCFLHYLKGRWEKQAQAKQQVANLLDIISDYLRVYYCLRLPSVQGPASCQSWKAFLHSLGNFGLPNCDHLLHCARHPATVLHCCRRVLSKRLGMPAPSTGSCLGTLCAITPRTQSKQTHLGPNTARSDLNGCRHKSCKPHREQTPAKTYNIGHRKVADICCAMYALPKSPPLAQYRRQMLQSHAAPPCIASPQALQPLP